MKLLLVGGTGVLSSAVTHEALKQGFEVTMINRGKRAIPDGVESLVFDCHDYGGIGNALAGRHFDATIDFLCYSKQELENSFRLYSRFSSQYLFISSCMVYDTRIGGWMDENSPKVLPMWQYSVGKWDCELSLIQLAHQSPCKVTVIRPSVTYGDTRIPYGEGPRYGFHWTLAARILARKPIIRWNGGRNRCNVTRVEDFAVGCIGLVGNPAAYGEAFNVCGDETPSWAEVLDALSLAIGKKAQTIDIPSEFYAREWPARAGAILGGRSIDSLCRNDKIKKAVPKFIQTIGLNDGIARTVKAYRERNFQNGIDWRYDADSDRIIDKWCKQRGIPSKGLNLGFVDYLGNASFRDRMEYAKIRHGDSLAVRTLLRMKRKLAHATILFKCGKK